MVCVIGAELVTGNMGLMIPAVVNRKASVGGYFKNLSLVYIGNFVGSVIYAYFFVYLTDSFPTGSATNKASMGIASAKISKNFGIMFLKGIGCNWLVNLAICLNI